MELSQLPPDSDLMGRSDGFATNEVRLPAKILGPELLYASVDSFKENDIYHNILDEDNALTTDDAVEKLGPVESMKQSFLRDILEGSLNPNYRYEPSCDLEFDPFPESSRDCKHVGDLRWHGYYHMSQLGETALRPMRYTRCDPSTGQRCLHRPSPVLQIFDMKVQTFFLDSTTPVEVYGIVAVRDDEDYHRNYLFNRSRDNPLAINPISDHLRLMSPKRAISMIFDCLIEVDIRVKAAGDGAEDLTIIDGCMDFIEDEVCLGTLYKCSSYGPYGITTLDMIIFEFGVEATIELEFLIVPPDGFELRMCGYTSNHKNVYTFIDKNRECDSFVNSVGRHLHPFVAAVEINDTLNIDFLEGGKPLSFKAAIHGSQKKPYRFRNGAVVSVMLCWSTVRYSGDNASDVFTFSDSDED